MKKRDFLISELVYELYSVVVTQNNSCGISGYSLISVDNVHFDIIKKEKFLPDLNTISVFQFIWFLRVNGRAAMYKVIQNKLLRLKKILI